MKSLAVRFRDYFLTAFTELQKVVWPTRAEVIRSTATITLTVAITVLILGLVDFGLTSLLRLIIVNQ